jgi:hypothetical protein
MLWGIFFLLKHTVGEIMIVNFTMGKKKDLYVKFILYVWHFRTYWNEK